MSKLRSEPAVRSGCWRSSTIASYANFVQPDVMRRVQYRVAAILGGAAISLLVGATTGSAQTVRPPGYVEAEAVYQSALTAENRIFLQVLLTGAGYWNAVPNENFKRTPLQSHPALPARETASPRMASSIRPNSTV